MKKNLIVAALVAAASLSATNAMAENGAGKINFTGSITDTACTIVNDQANPLDVKLGEYGTNEFKAAGDATARVTFKIALTDCPATATKAAVNFDGNPDATNGDLLQLTQGADVAKNVAIQLYEASGSELALRTLSVSQPLVVGDNTLPFMAAYKSTADAVEAGQANATANFSIVYN